MPYPEFSSECTNATVLPLGTRALNISVNDTSGNVNSTVITITVEDTTPPTLPSTGGQITVGVTTKAGEVMMTTGHVRAGQTKVFSIPTTSNMFFTELEFVAKKWLSGVISIKSLSEKPPKVSSAPGEVFKYIDVSPSYIKSEDIKRVKISFKVEKTWIVKNNIDTVVLNRFSEGQWDALTTAKDSEDEQYVHYSAESPGLSVFGISGQVQAVTTTTSTTTTVPATIAPTTTTTAPPAAPTTTAPPAEEKKGICGPTAVLLLAMLFPALLHIRRKSR